MRGIFVTGTDTGVGKTYFSSSLVRFLREKGVDAVGFKPVETGCSPRCEDSEELSRASGRSIPPVYSLREPLAPSVASEIEGVTLDEKLLVRKTREVISSRPTVVEGAGGILVPITWKFSFLDLAKELSLPVVVVALNKLGVINHTLLTVEACLRAGLNVRGVVLNSFRRTDKSSETNLYSLKKLLSVPVVPFFDSGDIPEVVDKLNLLEIFLQ